jgi:predicted phage terminase large subunit-like protein
MASFEALGSEIFKEEWVQFDEDEPDIGDYYIAIDLAGFDDPSSRSKKNKRLDSTAISVVKVNEHGWYVKEVIYGRWTLEQTAQKIFNAVDKFQPVSVGIERGIAKQAVMSPLTDLMKQRSRFFRVEELTHGNQKKIDRIVWALQGRFENGMVTLNKGEWNSEFLDQLFQFPNHLVHDDLIDSLAYIDQLAKVAYHTDLIDLDEEFEPLDLIAGY